ncbi:MAG: DNA-processing protein DprA [Oscillospiraceae bacterium]|nr:DNA-processing protein DprA [Oscillospiraceae bacterium]
MRAPEDKKYWIWLGAMTGINAKKANLLLERYRDPFAVFEASGAELSQLEFMNRNAVSQLLDRNIRRNLGEVAASVFQKGIDVITIFDDEYPETLKRVFDPPIMLFRRGKARVCRDCIAIVGTRHPSAYGQTVAWRLAGELAGHGYTVVSGMAMGIDATAHKSALAAGGETVAVLGGGVDRASPVSNGKLMDEIMLRGAVYSEFLPGSFPQRANFPRRNRIISGMSIATIVVEAGEKSGALITAGFSAEQGKDVFSVPGNITSPLSVGTNALIRDGAIPVTCTEDVLFALDPFLHASVYDDRRSVPVCEELVTLTREKQRGAHSNDRHVTSTPDDVRSPALKNQGAPTPKNLMAPAPRKFSNLNVIERKIVDFLRLNGPAKTDDIISQCRFKGGEANSSIIILEMKGVLKLLPGMYYGLD